MKTSINDKSLFREFVPAKRNEAGEVTGSSYFQVSEEELQAIKKLGKSLRGGNRPGSGRKLKYGEEAVYLGFDVPLSKKEHIRKVIKRYLKKYEVIRTSDKLPLSP